MKTIIYLSAVSIIFFLDSQNLFAIATDSDNWVIINGDEFNSTKIITKSAADLDYNSVVYTTGNDMSNLILGASYNEMPCNVVANINGNKAGSTQSIYCNVQVNGSEYISASPFPVTVVTYGTVGTIVSGNFSTNLINMANGQSISVEIHFAAMRKTDLYMFIKLK